MIGLKLDNEDHDRLRRVFKKLDERNQGSIGSDEVGDYDKALKACPNVAKGKWGNLIRRLDLDGNGLVDFREFLTAAIDHKKYLTKANIDNMFEVFDKDKDNHISMEEFEFYLPSSKWHDVIMEVFGEEKKEMAAEQGISRDEFIDVMNNYGKAFFGKSLVQK